VESPGRRRGFDAYIHTGCRLCKREDIDRRAVDTLLGAAVEHAARINPTVFIYTSGVWVLIGCAAARRIGNPGQLMGWRPSTSGWSSAATNNLRTAVIRPGSSMADAADRVGPPENAVVADSRHRNGDNHWPLVPTATSRTVRQNWPRGPGPQFFRQRRSRRNGEYNRRGIVAHFSMPPDVARAASTKLEENGGYADALALDQQVRSERAHALGWAPAVNSVSANVPRLLEEFRRGQEQAA
jgi:hypothetical protein